MSCSDSSSGLNLYLDPNARFLKLEFAKIPCSGEITAQTGYSHYSAGKTLEGILDHSYQRLVQELGLEGNDEKQCILHL